MLQVLKHYIFYFFVLFQTAILFIISTSAQTKDKTINWPEPSFEHITIADGLPENSVRCILQDHLGYLWLGTQNGLVRYDGYEMKVYQPDPDDSLSISDRQIYSIYEDKSKTLWVGTSGGLNKFDRINETFKRYTNNPNDSTSINSNKIVNIYEDNSGNLWVSTYRGLSLFDRQTEYFRNIYYKGLEYSPALYEYILSLIAKKKRISSILRVGNNADLTKSFIINKETVVLTVIMDEAGSDDGWLESTGGEIIAGRKNKNIVYTGGNSRNQIEIEVDTLPIGNYKLRYVSDASWSYNHFQGDYPPDYPEFWGIQVIELGEEQMKIGEIQDYENSTLLNCMAVAIIEDLLTGNLFVGANNKISILDREKNYLTEYSENAAQNFNLGEILSFHQSPDRTIWLGHTKGLAKFNSMLNTIKYYQQTPSIQITNENNIGTLAEDERGFIWGTGAWWNSNSHGLYCFDPENEQFKTYKHIPEKQESLSSNIVISVYRDRSGIMWVGTGWAGLNKWDRNKQKFKRFSFDPDNSVNGKFNRVYSIVEDPEGIIWFGTDNGLYSYNRFSNGFKNYKYNSLGKSNRVRHIYIDEDGIIWLGTLTKGLGKFNPVSGLFHFYSNDINDVSSISNNRVMFILPDNNDFLWIGTIGGLNRFDKKTVEFIRYNHDLNNPHSLSQDEVECLYEDRQGRFWIGTDEGGLNLFNRTDESFESYNFEGDSSTSINSIYEDSAENFWIGTYQTGLYMFNGEQGVPVYNITEKDGLANNQIKSILEDDSGNLWISTENGLTKFDPQTRTIKNYFTPDGFDGNRYSMNSAFKTSAGEMLFGTYDGFIIFHPDSIKDDPVPPQVVISNVSLFNEPDKKLKFNGFISELKELNLSYDENDLRFNYVGLQYADPSKNKYKYKLEGFDKDWVDAGTQRNATYTNLDAGEYTFGVTASNSDGTWNKEGASIKIIISPPIWATWWAYGFYLIIFGSILFGIRKYEMNRQLWKHRMELETVEATKYKEINRMKSHFFANISHEFRTPLTLILGPSENILAEEPSENTIKQASTIKRNANRLLLLISQLLDLSKLEAGKLELKASKANIVPFIKGFTMSFESLAEGKDITLRVSAEKEQIELYFDKEKMIKIMSNLLSNAFKFTPEGGHITVTVGHAEFISATTTVEKIPKRVRNDNVIFISVKDTGIGISQEELPKLFDRFYQVDDSNTREHEGTGIGLALVKELVELHQGKISVDSEPGDSEKAGTGWTEFTIELPLGRKHLRNYEIIEDEVFTDEVIMTYAESGAKKLNKFDILDSSRQQDRKALSVISRITENISETNEDKTLILVVEDNIDVREFIKDSIGNEFQIEEASNGEQGVRKAEQIIPDLIISDIMMPKMDGNELTRTLKNNEKTSHIPIILLTAKSEQQSKLEGLETGADAYLTKPFDTKELQIRINNLIYIRKKLQEKYSQADFVPVKKAEEKKLSNLEEQFMCKVMEVVENHLSEEEFSIEQFGKEVGMSRMQLHRKLKALTGKSASNYLRSIRLTRAKKMIEDQKGTISEIAYSVGFSSPQYFTRSFKEEFGFPPSELT